MQMRRRAKVLSVQNGHSFVELLVVMAILMILVAMESMNYFWVRQKAQEAVRAASSRVGVSWASNPGTRAL